MINYTCNFTEGILASFTCIYLLNYLYSINPEIKRYMGSYRRIIIYLPLYFGIITIIISQLLETFYNTLELEKIKHYNPYIKGAFIGFILAFLGKYFWDIDDLLGIYDTKTWYTTMVLSFIMIYGFILEYIKDGFRYC